MKIFFTTPFNGKKLYQKYVDEIIEIVESSGSTIVSPEKSEQYNRAFTSEKMDEYGGKDKAHYAFIKQGIVGADAVIFESTYEDFRVGHEATLGLMYGKPVLVLSQKEDYSQYISHEKFFGGVYKNTDDLKNEVNKFLDYVSNSFNKESYQALDDVVDLQHSSALTSLRYRATQGKSYFADWARRSASEPDKVYEEILDKLGKLSIQPAWDVFAKVYNEDTPDSVFYGAVRFADKIFRSNQIVKTDTILEAACGTGAVSRLMTSFGYRYLVAFDRSRAMLAEAYRLCSHLPSIKIQEADIRNIKLDKPVKGIAWFDFSSNFAMNNEELEKCLTNLINNLESDGILVFDVRTKTGWNIDFFKQKVTTYETNSFQRVWINLPDYSKNQITFDIYIRIKDKNGEWLPWEREQMTEKIWNLDDVRKVVNGLKDVSVEGVYGDDFTTLKNGSLEPGLAYFVLKKN